MEKKKYLVHITLINPGEILFYIENVYMYLFVSN